jgi:hypothetical protein
MGEADVPEMHSLGSNGAVPKLLEASGLGAGSRVDSSAGICALEERSEGAEDARARAEGHDCCVFRLALRLARRSKRWACPEGAG